MRRLMTFFLGMVAGGALLYSAERYHLVHAEDGLHLIPKLESQLAATYVDIRKFSPADWAQHADFDMAITNAEQGEFLKNSATKSLEGTMDGLFDRFDLKNE
jgi:hypothetical protein